MTDKDLKVFIDIICHYFEKTTRNAPELKEPVIELNQFRLLDYTGFIKISGNNQGWVYISMPKGMLLDVLNCMGESLSDRSILLDSVGEIVSIITSNAREHFGTQFQISVPVTSAGNENAPISHEMPRFLLPFSWREHQAYVGIALLA